MTKLKIRTMTKLKIMLATISIGLVGALALVPAAAVAARPSALLSLHVNALPTHFIPGDGRGTIELRLTNKGTVATNESIPIVVSDHVPNGLTITSVAALRQPSGEGRPCTFTSQEVLCSVSEALPGEETAGLDVTIHVTAESGASGSAINEAKVSGGGAGFASTTDPVVFSAGDPGFGLSEFYSEPSDAAGLYSDQAGAHPSSFSTGFVFNSVFHSPLNPEAREVLPASDPKDVLVDLPSGLVGNAQALPTCSQETITTQGKLCPSGSVVGTIMFDGEAPQWEFSVPGCRGYQSECDASLLYNVEPEHGYAAEFGFHYAGIAALIYVKLVHTKAGYIARAITPTLPRVATIKGFVVTFFGDPAMNDGGATPPVPFLTNPTSCTATGEAVVLRADSWENPAAVPLNPDGSSNFDAANLEEPQWATGTDGEPAMTGCEKLQFHPELEASATTQKTDSPSGLEVDLRIPQNSEPTGLATPELKDATVALPRGFSISPSSANGLQACTDAQIALESTGPASCPEASVIGTVKVQTPLLAEPLEGRVFVGSPECGPCTSSDAQNGRLVRLFVEITNPVRGVDVKIPGTVAVDPSTGQLTASFRQTPELPFNDLKFKFKSGETAPLSTPASCGSYSTSVDLTPWSTPYTPDASLSPSLAISEGCGAPGFAPIFTAGTTMNNAGSYSPFTLTFSRNDGEQYLDDVEQTLPPGLLAKLAGVPRCGDAEANAGTCPESTRIGTVTVAAGPGAYPYTVTGRIYLTGPYNGGPFGEVVVVPAVAGPFNLGTVVVRGSIRVNPSTVQASVVSDPFPTILDGIPLQVRSVTVTLDRENFIVNPTSCGALAVTGRLFSTQGAAAGVSSPFAATNCAALAFKPQLTASVSGRASKVGGAGFDVKVTYPQGPAGTYANTKSVKVDLPKQLPSRLTTLQKACLAATFEANPASCPAASDVGTATAVTPLLNVPVSGPAYLVSHGGEAFPDLEVVLQGEGVTAIVVFNTNIKKGITSSTLKAAPDVPLSSFELKLPTGKYSILGANVPPSAKYSLCGQSLAMPTVITGQNGTPIKQSTKIAVTGCPKAKKAKAAGRRAKRATKSNRRVRS